MYIHIYTDDLVAATATTTTAALKPVDHGTGPTSNL
jgi:hypothetical protein